VREGEGQGVEVRLGRVDGDDLMLTVGCVGVCSRVGGGCEFGVVVRVEASSGRYIPCIHTLLSTARQQHLETTRQRHREMSTWRSV
jgi:hypothetical protein